MIGLTYPWGYGSGGTTMTTQKAEKQAKVVLIKQRYEQDDTDGAFERLCAELLAIGYKTGLEAQKSQGWVYCKDRLPEVGELRLWQTVSGNFIVGYLGAESRTVKARVWRVGG